MEKLLKQYKWKLLGIALGALAGFLYWHFIGCNSGTCPIQSHWQSSTIFGALMGYLFANDPKKKRNTVNEDLKDGRISDSDK